MAQQWWRRLLPDRSHILLIATLAGLVAVGLGFIELYHIKAEALAERAAAQAQVQQLEEQKQMLQETLVQSQQGENVEPRAREYFKLVRPGEKKVVFQTPVAPEPAPEPTPRPAQSARPDWLSWLRRLLGR